MKITVVVDGGGTGCRLRAYDSQGAVRASAENGPASLTLGVDQAWEHINQGITELSKQLSKPNDWQPDSLYMGIAGALQQHRREQFLAKIPRSINTNLITDGHAQLLGATQGSPGICLAVGTGTVMYWLDKSGNIGKAGGWGFPVGDEGSGAWLGSQLINAYLWHRDTQNNSDNTPVLFKKLEACIGSSESDIQAWSTQTQSTKLASLVPVIAKAATQGDGIAESLLLSGAKQCEKLFALAPENLPIYLVGGLSSIYKARLNNNLQQLYKTARGDIFSGLYTLSLARSEDI